MSILLALFGGHSRMLSESVLDDAVVCFGCLVRCCESHPFTELAWSQLFRAPLLESVYWGCCVGGSFQGVVEGVDCWSMLLWDVSPWGMLCLRQLFQGCIMGFIHLWELYLRQLFQGVERVGCMSMLLWESFHWVSCVDGGCCSHFIEDVVLK